MYANNVFLNLVWYSWNFLLNLSSPHTTSFIKYARGLTLHYNIICIIQFCKFCIWFIHCTWNIILSSLVHLLKYMEHLWKQLILNEIDFANAKAFLLYLILWSMWTPKYLKFSTNSIWSPSIFITTTDCWNWSQWFLRKNSKIMNLLLLVGQQAAGYKFQSAVALQISQKIFVHCTWTTEGCRTQWKHTVVGKSTDELVGCPQITSGGMVTHSGTQEIHIGRL